MKDISIGILIGLCIAILAFSTGWYMSYAT